MMTGDGLEWLAPIAGEREGGGGGQRQVGV